MSNLRYQYHCGTNQRNLTKRSSLLVAEDGVSAIEFALVVSILCVLVLGILDFGVGFWEQMQVGSAAVAGADYAVKNGYDSSAIQTAVTSATGLSAIEASPAPSQSCGCPDATAGIISATCGASCSGGGTAGKYVTVNARVSYTTIFGWPGIPQPMTLTASTMVRIN